MRGIRIVALGLCLLALCSCGKEIKNYRVHDDTLISFTEALGERKLVSEELTKSEDGRAITKAEYTYKSDKAEEDKVNYLYYLLNHNDATFLGEDVVALMSRDSECAVMVKTSSESDTFTITITRPNLETGEE